MKWFDSLITIVANIAKLLWGLWLDIYGWYIAPQWLKDGIREIARGVDSTVVYLLDFREWVRSTSDKIASFLSLDDVIDALNDWLTWAQWAWEWVKDAGEYVTGYIDDWWRGVTVTVLSWIDEVRADLISLIGTVKVSLGELTKVWSDFWTITWPAVVGDLQQLAATWEAFLASTLPGLATWTGVGSVVDSTLKTWLPFYNDLAAIWDEIAEFFADPLQWIRKNIEAFLERFW